MSAALHRERALGELGQQDNLGYLLGRGRMEEAFWVRCRLELRPECCTVLFVGRLVFGRRGDLLSERLRQGRALINTVDKSAAVVIFHDACFRRVLTADGQAWILGSNTRRAPGAKSARTAACPVKAARIQLTRKSVMAAICGKPQPSLSGR